MREVSGPNSVRLIRKVLATLVVSMFASNAAAADLLGTRHLLVKYTNPVSAKERREIARTPGVESAWTDKSSGLQVLKITDRFNEGNLDVIKKNPKVGFALIAKGNPADVFVPSLEQEPAKYSFPFGKPVKGERTYVLHAVTPEIQKLGIFKGFDQGYGIVRPKSFGIKLDDFHSVLLTQAHIVRSTVHKDNFIWIGQPTWIARHEKGFPVRRLTGGLAVFTSNSMGRILYGQLDTLAGRFAMASFNGELAVREISSARFKPDHPGLRDRKPGPVNSKPSPNIALSGNAFYEAGPALPTNRKAWKSGPSLDIGIFYTPAAARVIEDTRDPRDIRTILEQAAVLINGTFVGSGISARVNPKLIQQIDYAEPARMEKALQCLMSDTCLPEIHERRADDGLDLVFLVIRSNDACGLSADDGSHWADPSYGFSVVDINCILTQDSLAHEMGHLLGARHDERWDHSSKPFAYGHGYVVPSSNVGTLMAVLGPPPYNEIIRVPYWSSPNVEYPLANGPTQLGTSTAYNAQVLRQTIPVVAGFFKH